MDLTILNNQQRQAVEHVDGPLLVLAGAGAGKTRVLTYRIASLIDRQHAQPYQILALTFTNKAAGEMKQRIISLVGQRATQISMGTFHSFCLRILHRYADQVGYTTDFVIYDAADQRTLIKNLMKQLNIDSKQISISHAKAVISDAKNKLLSVEKFQDLNATDFINQKIGLIYQAYQKQLHECNAMDFDDLIVNVIKLFQKSSDALAYYQNKFKYILVDEYQDTNYIQFLLVKQLAALHQNVCVVGDGDQSIYGWRGADIANIRDFDKVFSGAKVVLLEQNYRSTQRILELANGVIKNNTARRVKNLWTDNKVGDKIQYYCAENGDAEAHFVAGQIAQAIEMGGTYSDFAILYRTNAQSRTFENAFNRQSIPYGIVGGHKFYERLEIKDLMAYLRFIANPSDLVAFQRIVNLPKRGVGNVTLQRLEQLADTRQLSIFEALAYAVQNDALSSRALRGLRQFYQLVAPLIEQRNTLSGSEILKRVIEESGYRAELVLEQTTQAQSRLANIEELYNQVVEFEQKKGENDLNSFLQEISLLSDQDDIADDETGRVLLMTIHAAKGLEFPVVFLVGLEERLFPTARALEEDDVAEERRLCYVGITRAQQKLYITHATMRHQFGNLRVNQVSRFIEEMPRDIIYSHSGAVEQRADYQDSSAQRYRRYSFETATRKQDDNQYQPGTKVRHQQFGDGTVINVQNEKTLTVVFDAVGIKKLAIGFAPLIVIGD